MSASRGGRAGAACWECRIRAALLEHLLVPLDYRARDPQRLLAALALEDEQLIAALAGRRRQELSAWLRDVRAGPARAPGAGADGERHPAVCRHDPRFPPRMRGEGSPWMLFSSAGADELGRLARAPVVAITGSTRPSDYGVEMASALARGLAASRATVATVAQPGIAAAARAGAAELDGRQLAVASGGPECPPARGLRRREGLSPHCCLLAELPGAAVGRSFGEVAATRTLAGLAEVVVCVEARADTRELLAADIALSREGVVAAVPGQVTSPGAAGPNALLAEGAKVVRGPEDLLELLASRQPGGARAARPPAHTPAAGAALPPRLAAALDTVAGGRDTIASACAGAADPGAVLLALSELELLGLLRRGRDGRYVPRLARASEASAGEEPPPALKQSPARADD